MTYDVLDRPLVVTHPDQTTITTTYGNNVITTLNERGLTTTQTIDGRDQMVSLTDADGKVWNYTYHPAGQLHQIIGPVGLPESVTRTWEYDAKQQLASETHPESGTLTYEAYDAAGLLTRTRDAAGNAVSLTYDGDDRIKTVTAGSRVTTFTYETGSDNVTQMAVTATPTAPAVSTSFEYDTAGRVKKRVDTVDGKSFESKYFYDLNDNLKEVVYPSLRRIGYQYDAHNRLTRVYNLDTNANYATTFTYDGAGALRSYVMGNGITTTLAHHPDSYRLTAISSGPLQLTYAYDPGGNVEYIGDARPGMNQTFTYDPLDRLKTANGPYGGSVHDYDAHGNRTTSPGGTTYTYDANNRFRLAGIGGIGGYQYLANGNLASETAGTYAYTADSLLDSTALNGVTTRFAYDGQGWRIRKLVEQGPIYYYSRGAGGQLLSEWMNTSATTATARDYIYAGSTLLSVVTKSGLQAK